MSTGHLLLCFVVKLVILWEGHVLDGRSILYGCGHREDLLNIIVIISSSPSLLLLVVLWGSSLSDVGSHYKVSHLLVLRGLLVLRIRLRAEVLLCLDGRTCFGMHDYYKNQ